MDEHFWSIRLRHPEIEVKGNQIKRQTLNINKDALILTNAKLLSGRNSPYRWSVKIIQKACWSLYFGISLQSFAMKCQFDLTRNPHAAKEGQYILNICSKQLILPSESCIIKKAPGEYDVKEGDQIHLSYDEAAGRLEWNCNDREPEWIVSVKPPEVGDCYRPCMSLWRDCSVSAKWRDSQ